MTPEIKLEVTERVLPDRTVFFADAYFRIDKGTPLIKRSRSGATDLEAVGKVMREVAKAIETYYD